MPNPRLHPAKRLDFQQIGTYNHAPMIDLVNGTFIAFWKNSPQDEDQAGQRVLVSQSQDGATWTPGPVELFPNMSTDSNPAHLFASPVVRAHGRAYAGASPKQFCLWPDPYPSLLLLRQILPGVGHFGPVFWAANTVPSGFEQATSLRGVRTLNQMDSTTQADVAAILNPSLSPCDQSNATSKCEWCQDGCQDWSAAFVTKGLENERSHYRMPDGVGDVLLYRSYLNKKGLQHNYLYRSERSHPGANWTVPTRTDITNDVSNLNSGNLADGRAWLVNNWVDDPIWRNPLVVSLSEDGNSFHETATVADCNQLIFSSLKQPWGCYWRHAGGAKEGGPQYPQSLPVLEPSVAGFYTIFSLNKEDVISYRPIVS
mmetsp:Transcript_45353/g.107046  ORF Transcript_45353/g.107046 Transcript_45353/m.107046 type:complete len:371 (+) Transcript_45353:142-1254(+)